MCTCTVWLGKYYSHLHQSLFDRNGVEAVYGGSYKKNCGGAVWRNGVCADLCVGSCGGGGGGCVWVAVWGELCGSAVWEGAMHGWAVHMGLWPSIVQGSCVREAVWRLCG